MSGNTEPQPSFLLWKQGSTSLCAEPSTLQEKKSLPCFSSCKKQVSR